MFSKHTYVVGCIIVATVFLYSLLYIATLRAVHDNGVSTVDFVVGTGGDSYHYFILAQTLLSNGRFAVDPLAPAETFRTPVYPLVISGVLFFGKNIALLPVLQIIFAACSAALIFLLGRRFCSFGVGLAAALLFIFEPAVYTNAVISATDTLFVLILLLGIYVLVMPEKLTYWYTLLAGVFVGVLALVRPIGLYIFPLLLLWIVWEERKNWRRSVQMGGIFLAGLCLVVLPWMARNYAHTGHAAVSSVGIYNFLFYNMLEFEHRRTGVVKDVIRADMLQQIGATDADNISSLVFSDKEKEVALEYLWAHPVQYATFHLYSTIPFYLGSSIDTLQRAVYLRGVVQGTLAQDVNVSALVAQGDLRTALSVLVADLPIFVERLAWLLLCFASFLATVVIVWRRLPGASVAVLFFFLILAFGVLTGPVAYSRYRLPAEPFIFILGCVGIVLVVQYVRERFRLYLLRHSRV